MQKYFNNVTNRGGAALPSASVLVKTLAGATATIYSDNGTTPAANPIACDGNGYFEFYAADGRYSLTITGVGIVTQHIDDLILEDPIDTPTLASLNDPSGSSLIGFIQAGTGMVARTEQAKLRERLSLFDAAGDALAAGTDISAFVLTASAAAVAGSTSSKTIRLPAGTFTLASTLALGTKVSLVGDGSGSTIINYTGTGVCITADTPALFGGFTITSQAAGQSGPRITGGTCPRIRDVICNEFDGVGFQLGLAGTGGVFFADLDGLQCINSARVGTSGFVIDGGGALPNSNANVCRNVFVKGRWNTYYDIRGNANTIHVGDAEPHNADVVAAGSTISEVYKISGIGNLIDGPYIEPTGATYPACFFRFTSASQGNRVRKTYWTNTDVSVYSKIDDQGANNDVEVSPNGANFPQSAGRNNAQVNYAPNSGFRTLKADGTPQGWVLSGTGTAARSTSTVRGGPYSMALTVAAQNATLNCFIATPTPTAATRLPLITAPIAKFIGRTITVGCWAWSSQSGMGAVKVFTGVSVIGIGTHSGSSTWEFITASGRVDAAATEISMQLRTDTSNASRTGTCFFSEPVFVIGNEIPQSAPPRPITDGDSALAGRLTWSPPATLTVNSTTPDVSEGNFFKEANTVATTIANFTNGRVGQELKILTTSANTTLANNTAIVTTTGAAKALSSGVVYKLIFSDDSKWHEY